MTDSIDNALAAAIRSMDTVVIPAVDSSHPLAMEQAELVKNTLKLVREQLPYRQARVAKELATLTGMGESILPLLDWSPVLAERLSHTLTRARRIRTSDASPQIELEQCVNDLSTCLSAAVRGARMGEVEASSGIEEMVLSSSLPLVTDNLAWFGAQGWAAADETPSMQSAFDTEK